MSVRQFAIAIVATTCVVWATQVAAQDRLVQQGTDPATGATVRVYKSPDGARIEVDSLGLQLRKQVAGTRVVTSMKAADDELVIEFDQKTLTVTSSRGRASATRERQQELSRARDLVGRSPVAARTAALIGRMGFGADSPVRPLLLTTRAFLLAAAGDDAGTDDLSRWVRQAKQRVQIVKASFDQKTPTECWDAYAKEAITAWLEYEECLKDVRWWDIFGAGACALVYDLRAIGAFSWWLNCVSLMGVITG